jgi:phage terminase large subunit GpA-like protein
LWPVNTDIAKEELYRWLRSSVPDVSRGEKWPVGFCHFPQYSKEYFEQLCAEHLVTRTINGRRVSKWEKVRDRNEALDCRIYARAAAGAKRFEAWKDTRWDQEESKLTGARAVREPGREADAMFVVEPAQPVAPPAAPKFKPFRASESFLE